MSLEKIPWNMDNPPDILVNLVETNKIQPCQIIDLGCGVGNYISYLATKGFDSTGLDISISAIEIAKETARSKGVKCNFIVGNVIEFDFQIPELFECAYDWEVLHHVFPKDRNKYITNVAKLLKPNGKYMSVCFSDKSSQFGGKGKYRKTPINTELYFSSETEMIELFETEFEIEELETIDVAGKYGVHKAIYAFMIKKK